MRRLEHAVAAADDDGGSVALLVIDLDHFKELNDTLGHHAGDDLLRQIGPRLDGVLRDGRHARSARRRRVCAHPRHAVGPAAALRVADKVRGALADPFDVADVRIHVAASVGIALLPEHGHSADELLRMADVAMYEAKQAPHRPGALQRRPRHP